VFSSYREERYSITGSLLSSVESDIYKNFNLNSNENLVVQPSNYTSIEGNLVYSCKKQLNSWPKILPQGFYEVASMILQFLNLEELGSYRISEEVIADKKYATCLGTLKKVGNKMVMFAESIAESKEAILVTNYSKTAGSCFVSLVFGAFFFLMYRSRQNRLREGAIIKSPENEVSAPKGVKCFVCGSNPRDIIFDPCMHLVCCKNCARDQVQCPVCSEAVTKKIEIHFS